MAVGNVRYFLCIEHLHRFPVPDTADDLLCPECGCRYGRPDTRDGPIEPSVVLDVKQPYALPVKTWVSELPVKSEEPNNAPARIPSREDV